jgi:hypothetical protein
VTGGLFVLVLVVGLIPAVIASRKGRGFLTWWLFGAMLFIVALPMAIVAKDERVTPCPSCKKSVSREATVCPYCRRELAPTPVPFAL